LQVSISKLDNEDENENDTSRISVWCRALQQVAFQVAKALDLPPNLLLDTNTNPTISLDLMRVFYYHAVDVDNNNNNNNNQEQQSMATTTERRFLVARHIQIGEASPSCGKMTSEDCKPIATLVKHMGIWLLPKFLQKRK
jgi:hypothetical protein